MKKLSTLIISLGFISLHAQTTIYSENFEGGAGTFSLNTTDLGSMSSAFNFWTVNNNYAGGTDTIMCFGTPFGYTINSTNAQPGPVFNSPNGSYLHTMSQEGQSDGIFCSSFAAADGFCVLADSIFTRMTNDVSTVGFTNVSFSFYWACGGGTNIYGQVYYSTNAGGSWNLCSSPTAQYKDSINWSLSTITLPAFDGQSTLRFGFRFLNNVSISAVDPGFSIDDVKIIGTSTSGINEENVKLVNVYPNPTDDIFNIKIDDQFMDHTQISIINMVGETIFTKTPHQTSTPLSTKALGLKSGVYLVQIKHDDQQKVVRLVVK